jgi:hypothetical protein
MPGPVHRNLVVKFFGTPHATEGSLNEPREREEHGMRFNEKWAYNHPLNDPAQAHERFIYWRRYDYVGSVIRREAHTNFVRDDALPETLQRDAATLEASTDTHIAE